MEDPQEGMYARLIERTKEYQERLDDRTRTMAFGVLAIVWGLLVGDEHTKIKLQQGNAVALFGIGFIAVLTLTCEYIGYWAATAWMPHARNPGKGFRLAFAISLQCKRLKHILGIIAPVSLLVVLGLILWRNYLVPYTATPHTWESLPQR